MSELIGSRAKQKIPPTVFPEEGLSEDEVLELWANGWALSFEPLLPYDIKFMQIYVHPLKKRSTTEALLRDLEVAVKIVSAG